MKDKPIPEDLYALWVAHGSGGAAQRAGFPESSNHYLDAVRGRFSLAAERLKAWAWDLGWRESAWVELRAAEKFQGTYQIAERIKEGRL